MVDQAAESVMAAFRDGISRQSVRLPAAQTLGSCSCCSGHLVETAAVVFRRLDMVCPPNRVVEAGMEALLNAALPMAQVHLECLQKLLLHRASCAKECFTFKSGARPLQRACRLQKGRRCRMCALDAHNPSRGISKPLLSLICTFCRFSEARL